MAVGRVQLSQFRVHAKAQCRQFRVGIQSNRTIAAHMMARPKTIAGRKHIPGQVLQQVHRPGRRLLFRSPLQTEGQFKPVTALLRNVALFFVKLCKPVSDIVPVGDAMFAFPNLYAVQRVLASQSIRDHRTVKNTFLAGIEPLERTGNGIKSLLRKSCFSVHFDSSIAWTSCFRAVSRNRYTPSLSQWNRLE